MENIKNTHLVVGAALIVIVGLALYFYVPNRNQTEETPEQTATTTTTEEPAPVNDQGPALIMPEDGPQEEETKEDTKPQVQVSLEPAAPQPKELGPRLPADSAASALKFFAEAAAAGDIERAVSYFSENVQKGYRTTLTEYQDRGTLHPVVASYLNGTVDEVELTQPENGLYEIAVYPNGSQLPFRVDFVYDNSVGEFVITEL